MARASKAFPLRGWYVISLRPLGEHAGVRRAARQFAASTFAVSTLRLRPLAAAAALRRALRCKRVVVTSPAAARHAHAQVALSARPGQRWFALGGGTAAALHRRGVAQVLLPERGSDSEALLAHPDLQRVAGETIALISAPGGRGLLASSLQARGAELQVAEVYRREPRPPGEARLRALTDLPMHSAVLLTSSDAFAVLWQALDATARHALLQRPCVASSPRLREQAQAFGFATVLQAADARPASLLAALAAHVRLRGFR